MKNSFASLDLPINEENVFILSLLVGCELFSSDWIEIVGVFLMVVVGCDSSSEMFGVGGGRSVSRIFGGGCPICESVTKRWLSTTGTAFPKSQFFLHLSTNDEYDF